MSVLLNANRELLYVKGLFGEMCWVDDKLLGFDTFQSLHFIDLLCDSQESYIVNDDI